MASRGVVVVIAVVVAVAVVAVADRWKWWWWQAGAKRQLGRSVGPAPVPWGQGLQGTWVRQWENRTQDGRGAVSA